MDYQLLVREARKADVPAIAILIREFAEFEKLSDWCEVTDDDLLEAIFGKKSFVQVLVALAGNRYAGYVLYFPVFRSFRNELEFVPAHRIDDILEAALEKDQSVPKGENYVIPEIESHSDGVNEQYIAKEK